MTKMGNDKSDYILGAILKTPGARQMAAQGERIRLRKRDREYAEQCAANGIIPVRISTAETDPLGEPIRIERRGFCPNYGGGTWGWRK